MTAQVENYQEIALTNAVYFAIMYLGDALFGDDGETAV